MLEVVKQKWNRFWLHPRALKASSHFAAWAPTYSRIVTVRIVCRACSLIHKNQSRVFSARS
jgi:hypothetical protein